MHELSLIAAAWIGVVIANAIGAGVKFNAELLTREAGLDVGRHVFSAVGKLEWVLAVAMLAVGAFMGPTTAVGWWLIATLIAMLAIQTMRLRPILNARASAIIGGRDVPKSPAHAAYMGAELVKLIAVVAIVWIAVA